MANAALRRLNKIQKKLYDSMVPQAKNLATGINRDVFLYSKRFAASLPKVVKPSSFTSLEKSIHSAPIILFGDFHTHKQSQKEFRRVVEKIMATRGVKTILALECFRSCDQVWLDRYMQNKISSDVLLTKTKYQEHWGFPEKSYLALLDFAKQQEIQVYAINSRGAGRDPLAKRDDHMARSLVEISQEHPGSKVFCLVGEFHLADSSLPQYLGLYTPKSFVRIVLNIDQYYFEKSESARPNETLYLCLGKNFYCIMNSAPWLKWQSFAIWQESKEIATSDSDDELEHELEYDVDSHFYTLGKVLNEYLDLKLSEHQLTDFHIYYGPDNLSDFPRLNASLSSFEEDDIHSQLDSRHHTWLAQEKSLLLAKIDTNTLAEGAGRHLYAILSRYPQSNQSAELFYHRILETAFAIICSKIINPQRKYPDLGIMMKKITSGDKSWKDKIDPIDRLVKKHLNWLIRKQEKDRLSYHRPLHSIYKSDAILHGKISYRLGELWGSHLYNCLIDGLVNIEELSTLFFPTDNDLPQPWHQYLTLARTLFPHPHSTKRRIANRKAS